MSSSQKGFTLVELVVVIVVLGILAATALPKFIDLSSDARKSVVQATEGSMRAANTMIYAKAVATGNLTNASLTVGSATISTTNGFATTITDLAKVMDLDSTKLVTDSTNKGVYYNGYAVGTCGVVYGPSAAAGTPPTYATTVSGC
ncbi:prepilin-type N-terminal cleavage/methylation domain-containing protein [Rhodocyclus tenuis]|uniref:prepilin-type N-terminal cleavage/methylation domain-containing protein n=1 Tax=Rhodocyclus gracilis TaxID=2929842 RepID=UPI001298BD36|nr:prepilin-type N-terminal cleavage/methylation domain-containing protein [Rhodocyclus gracilis]MRD72695.1 prepilin-type N-terminal cleavage/methylation domain-containing protein [Rhodocyclus gracilis]